MSDHAEHAGHSEHIVPVWVYVSVFLALLVLTGLTTGVAFIDLGPFNTVGALFIAVVKMLLVVLFFMHVRYNKGLSRIVIIAAFFWLGIMIALTLGDELTRKWEMNPAPWSVLLPLLSRFL
jgi:cytochrome c oxidase subunit IV